MPGSLQVALHNATNSSAVFAYITGLSIQNNDNRVFIKQDGSQYFPSNVSAVGSPLQQDPAIHLGAPGNTVNVTIPQIAGGRVWFSINKPLTFLLNPSNPAPALVEPSVLNPADPNYQTNFSFCEFTLNNDQLFANISYVDFVSNLPVGLTLTENNGQTQTVTGMGTNGLSLVAQGLRAQAAQDHQPWDQLIVHGADGNLLRALSPNHGRVTNASLFQTYYNPYVTSVYARYAQADAKVLIDTQASFGIVNAHVVNNQLLFSANQAFSEPSTGDIFSCSTGPFATGSDPERNAIIPRLAAAFNRSTLLDTQTHPATPGSYYQNPTTNHYSRIVHLANADGKGYAFPYDDVQPNGGADQSGKVTAGDPKLWTISVGGGGVGPGQLGTRPFAGPPRDRHEEEGQKPLHGELRRDVQADGAGAGAGAGAPVDSQQQQQGGDQQQHGGAHQQQPQQIANAAPGVAIPSQQQHAPQPQQSSAPAPQQKKGGLGGFLGRMKKAIG